MRALSSQRVSYGSMIQYPRMKITKSPGERVEYDEEKVRQSMLRSKAKPDVIEHVLARTKKKLHEGMTTSELYHLIYKELHKRDYCSACRYDLRQALFRLGPAGFKFEQYVAAILRARGGDAFLPEGDLEGACVWHEVDVVIKDGERDVMIEAKFRNDAKHYVNLKDTMATWARYLDLQDAARMGKNTPSFDEVWIMTNARFSDRSRQFGACKGMKLIGWSYPKEESFEHLVDHHALYPVTSIGDLSTAELEALARANILLCQDMGRFSLQELIEKTALPQKRLQALVHTCQEITSVETL